MVRQFVTIKQGVAPVIDNSTVTFIVALSGRSHNIAGFVANVRRFYPDCKIVFSVLPESEAWNKGALYNLGFKDSNTEIVVFADVDCRLRERFDFGTALKQQGKALVPFDRIANYKDGLLINTTFRLTAWGGFAAFTRKMFEDCGGYTNQIDGWGFEDELIKNRSGMVRVAGVIDHIYHERKNYESKNTGQLDKNKAVLLNDNAESDNLNTVEAEKVLEYKENGVVWVVWTGVKNRKVYKSSKKAVVINQFFGIGDILFIEPICRRFWQGGHRVIIPVMKQFLSLQSHFPYIEFVDKDKFDIDYENQCVVETEEHIIYPVRWSMEYFKSPLNDTMKNKYKMFDLPLDTWRELTWLRHRWREERLMKHLGISKEEGYNLIQTVFHSYRNSRIKIKTIDNGLKTVELLPIEGYSLLDWATVIENAKEIHVVNTSSLYLFETLNLKAKEIHLYSRNVKGRDFQQTEYLRTKNYILHD